jgi:hypothetical protein
MDGATQASLLRDQDSVGRSCLQLKGMTMTSDAHTLTITLSGRWYRRYGAAPCPVCQPEARRDQNALTLSDGDDGRLLLHCKKSQCSYTSIRAALAFQGIHITGSRSALLATAKLAQERRDEEMVQANRAFSLWREAQQVEGTLAEHYLRKVRGITVPLPSTLWFHPRVPHPTGLYMPAMLAWVEGIKLFAVHRTFLLPDGNGKSQRLPEKAMLGPCAGGAVRLAESSDGPLVVCEGIETGLSLVQLMPEPVTVWAALGTAGMKGLCLPTEPGQLIVATDGDEAGRDAGRSLAMRAVANGWRVELLPASDGTDWNDYLRFGGAK